MCQKVCHDTFDAFDTIAVCVSVSNLASNGFDTFDTTLCQNTVSTHPSKEGVRVDTCVFDHMRL